VTDISIEDLSARIDALTAGDDRRILGLTGAPGSGKSTLAQQIVEHVADRSVLVPMDGFHLANVELARLGRSARKGAEDTFDSAGYVALLRRLRDQRAGEIVYAPEFRREIEESIAGAIPVFAEHRLIVTEGNYLLLDTGCWIDIRPLVDEIWYIDLDPQLRLERLVARHIRYGREERAAREWVARTDEPNAVLIASTRARADLVIRVPARADSNGPA
jgi:pantothenate kinase